MSAVCLTLLAINIAVVELLYRKNLKSQLEDVIQNQDELLETYLADAEFLAQSDLAKALDGSTVALAERGSAQLDAGTVVNGMLFWAPPTEFGRRNPLVPAKSREFLMRYEDDWIKGRSFVERGNVKADIGMFTGLERFQIWDLEKNSPLEPLVSRGEFILPSQLPLPDTLDLITAAKVRLMRGSIDGNPLQALKEVRHFATLLMTTENFQLVMTGLAVLDLERRAYREYVDRDWLDAATWLPIDRNTAMRAGRAYTATVGYFRAVTRESTFRKIFASGKIPPGFCAAANEQLPIEYAYRSQLTGLWPFERSYREGFQRLDDAFDVAKKHCRLKRLRRVEAEDAFGGVSPDAPWPLGHLPYFRGLFAMRDWASWPTHLDRYQRR